MPRALLAALFALLIAAPAAHALPEGAAFEQTTIRSGDGTELAVDVIRKEGTPAGERQPVVLVVSPYTERMGGEPSDRFDDFVEATDLLDRGFTYAIVTMRSFGDSKGCSDWGGPGEQMDVVAGVEWMARQPFSNGNVILLGKSYDGWTGLMGIANQPRGLAGVISQEPVYDGYKYLYDDGIRFVNSVLTPTSFMTTAVPQCAVEYVASQQDDNELSAFWQARELTDRLKGTKTPVFLMQGLLEQNTKPEGFVEAWENLGGPKRAWFGQFDHVRGTDKEGDKFAVGREDFAAQMVTFLDAYGKGSKKAEKDWEALPQVQVQDTQGRWRDEAAWPPKDVVARRTELRPGAYADTGTNFGSGDGLLLNAATPNTGQGAWSVSQAMPRPVQLAGEPEVDLDLVSGAPRSNLVVNVYDIAPNGSALLVSRGAKLLYQPGPQRQQLELYGQDHTFPAGHRIGVLVSGANNEWYTHVPTGAGVVVREAFISLPLLRDERTGPFEGYETGRLRSYKSTAKITVPAPVITAFQTPFDVGDR